MTRLPWFWHFTSLPPVFFFFRYLLTIVLGFTPHVIILASFNFSSPELKAEVSFSDRPLSGCLSVCPSVNFYIFDFFSRTAGQILTRLGTNHSWVKRIQVCSKEGDSLSSRGDNSERVKIYWKIFKNLLLQNQQAKFNQT
jgi:hypothetical protein